MDRKAVFAQQIIQVLIQKIKKKNKKKKNKGGYKGKTHLNKRNNNLENLIKTAEFKQKMLESLLKKM